MKDLKRVSVVAIILLVVLRFAIGWQFLYEGLWKYDSMQGPSPWTSEGYLKNAAGPFRDQFRNMVDDPDELDWLDYDHMSAKWDRWRDRFIAHYQLDDAQQENLNRLLDGAKVHTRKVSAMPASVDFYLPQVQKTSTDARKLAAVVTYDPDQRTLTVQGDKPLVPSEVALLRKEISAEDAKTPDGKSYLKAVQALSDLSGRLGYRQKLAANLKGDPERVGVTGELDGDRYRAVMGTATRSEQSDEEVVLKYGEEQTYRDMLAKYKQGLKNADVDFQRDHLDTEWKKLTEKRLELVNPIRALEKSLGEEAQEDILRPEQLSLGPVPPERTKLWWADQQVMWALIVLGALLILGLCTRLAALGGAVMLISFYLVMPPWPGVPPAPGPEHAFIVNKNLIEAIALLALAALPSGSWFGLDAIFRALFSRRES